MSPREFFCAGFRMLLALAGVANEQQQIAALQEQVAAQQAQMAALQAQVAALVQNAASAAAQPAAAPGAGRALSESPGDIATSIVIGTDGAQVELGNDVSGNILLRPASGRSVAVNGSVTVAGNLSVSGALTHGALFEFNGPGGQGSDFKRALLYSFDATASLYNGFSGWVSYACGQRGVGELQYANAMAGFRIASMCQTACIDAGGLATQMTDSPSGAYEESPDLTFAAENFGENCIPGSLGSLGSCGDKKVEIALSGDKRTVDLTLRVYKYRQCTAQLYVNPD